jgi:hypothetical protein
VRTGTDTAVRDYARRHGISDAEAANRLLERALWGELDEGTQAMLAEGVYAAAARAARREILDQMPALLAAQTDRLAGLLVLAGRDAAEAATLAQDALAAVTGDVARAKERAENARLAARARYTREGIKRELGGGGRG